MSKRAKANSVRIIGGRWRGRRLSVLDADGLRPTIDRVRETLFNWLMHDVNGARCLDLFAGTGALGIEALSRGAAEVTFVERDRAVCQGLKANLGTLKTEAGKTRVVEGVATSFLSASADAPFDIVFLDPPFVLERVELVVQQLAEGSWIAENSLVYIEQAVDRLIPGMPELGEPYRSGRAGQSQYHLYCVPAN